MSQLFLTGIDDFNNFSKDAPESGAWLIANSYGTNYSKDENGYFWVSYYDPSLCEYYTFEGVSADTYQTIFQYDGNGWNNSLRSPEEVKTANVIYSRWITAVTGSCFLYSTGGSAIYSRYLSFCIRERSNQRNADQRSECEWQLCQNRLSYGTDSERGSRCRWREVFGGYYICDRG